MAPGWPMPQRDLSEDEIQQLQSIANSRSYTHSLVQRAQIVLACGGGETNTAIAYRMGVAGMTQGLLEVIMNVSPPLVSSPAARAAP